VFGAHLTLGQPSRLKNWPQISKEAATLIAPQPRIAVNKKAF
jgi:hypothetical protein